MRHFTCDKCGQPLGEERFSASIEVRAEFDPTILTEADLDADHLAKMSELIRQIEESGVDPEDETETRTFAFDLCQDCRNCFVLDPLGRKLPQRLNFSKN